MKAKLALIMAELLKIIKQQKSDDYRSGYVDGILDFYNAATKEEV